MNDERFSSEMSIGATLKEARTRRGLEIAEVEERTKIRARYLRALESEDWEILPAPAYVRGFLRTYGQLVGLDGEMLADEFRRRYEQPETAAIAGSEPVLQERKRRLGARPTSRWPLIGAIAVAIVALLVVLGITADDDDGGDRRAGKQARQDGKGGKGAGNRGGGGADQQSRRKPVDLSLVALSDVRVCLVAGGDRALLASQLLSAGSEESFEDERRYRIDVEGGEIRLRVGGERERIETTDAVTYEADSNGIESTGSFAGPECP